MQSAIWGFASLYVNCNMANSSIAAGIVRVADSILRIGSIS